MNAEEKCLEKLRQLAKQIAVDASTTINDKAPKIKGTFPYKCQFVLEELIKELQSRV